MKIGDRVHIVGTARADMLDYASEGVIVDYNPEHDGSWPFIVHLKNSQGDLIFAFGRDELEVVEEL